MEVIICAAVFASWLLILIGLTEFICEVFMSIIKKEFNLQDTVTVFGFLAVLSVYVLWLGIQLLS